MAADAPKALLWGHDLILFYNDAYAELFDLQGGQGLGEEYPKFRPKSWKAVKPAIERAMSGRAASIVLDADPVDFEVTKTGNFFVQYTPTFDASGAIRGVLAEISETTDQVLLQERLEGENRKFRELFDQAPVFMALGSAPEMRFEYVNKAYQDLIGGRKVLGMKVADALPEVEEQGLVALLQEVYETAMPIQGEDVPLRLNNFPSGEPTQVYLDFVYQPIFDEEKAVTGILCVGYDVTEKHVANERTEKLEIDLQHALRVGAMGTMALTLAHELNQPLTSAANYLVGSRRLLKNLVGEGKAKVEAGLSEAEAQIQRTGEIIRRVRGMVDGSAARREEISIKEIVRRSIKLFDATGGCEDTKITTRLTSEMKLVKVDTIQIEQVMLNLLRNACDAMEDVTTREILISSRICDHQYAEIRVEDRGRGLPPGDPDQLFTALTGSTSGGLGVGLSLSRTIVERHGGRIDAENGEDGGAAFYFTLPTVAN